MGTKFVCTKRSSEKVIPQIPVYEYRGNGYTTPLTLVVEAEPGALLIKRPVESPLLANTCGNCGHVEFVTKYPEKLWKAYKSRKK